MIKWITRLSKTGARVSDTKKCGESVSELRNGIQPMEACINKLLDPGEQVRGAGVQRPIVKGTEIVGFLEVVGHPPLREAKRRLQN